jgi:hypothetical protein
MENKKPRIAATRIWEPFKYEIKKLTDIIIKVTSDLPIRLSACHVSQQCTNEVDLGQGGFPMSVVFGPPLWFVRWHYTILLSVENCIITTCVSYVAATRT